MSSPVELQFEAFSATGDSDATVFENDMNIQTVSGELLFGSVPTSDFYAESTGNVLGLELFAAGDTATSFRATVTCPNDVHVPPPPPPLDPCDGGDFVMAPATIDFLGGYENNMMCTWDISCPADAIVTVTFNQFATEAGWDFVGVDHIAMTSCSDSAATCYSGSGPAGSLSNGQSEMQIRFESDGSVTEGTGFEASVTCEQGNGRRRRQLQQGNSSTVGSSGAESSGRNSTARGSQAVEVANQDAWQIDTDKCVATKEARTDSSKVAECEQITSNWDKQVDPDGDEMAELCEDTDGCQHLEGRDRFVFLIPLDSGLNQVELNITDLKKYLWVDQKTMSVEVRFATYNGNTKLFSIVKMAMQFELSGQITRSIKVDSVNLELWDSVNPKLWDMLRILLELCILIFTAMNMRTEMTELRELGFGYFSEGWNYVDIMSVWLFTWASMIWAYLFYRSLSIEIPNKFNLLTVEDRIELLMVMDTLTNCTERFHTYKTLTALNIMVCFARFFKFAKAQERLNIVNETLAKAFVDLAHFLITCFISFLCFAVMGCVMFGFKMTEFKSVANAFHALFNMSIGDTGLWEEMRIYYPIAGMLYQYSFFVLMGFVSAATPCTLILLCLLLILLCLRLRLLLLLCLLLYILIVSRPCFAASRPCLLSLYSSCLC
jgi:hypothetical protein